MFAFCRLSIIFLVLAISSLSDVWGAPLKVVTELSPPLQNVDNGTVTGSATNKVREFLARANVKYEIELYPWSTAYKFATTRDDVLIYSMAKTPEREAHFHWLIPTFIFKPYLVGKINQDSLKITSIDQAKQFKIAVQEKDFAHRFLIDLGFTEGKNLFLTSTILDSWNMLKHDKVDFIVEDMSLLTNNNEMNINKIDYQSYLPVKALNQTAYLAANQNINEQTLERLIETLKRYY